MQRTELLQADACLRLGICRNMVFTAWVGSPERDHARALGRAVLRVAGIYGKDFGILDTIVDGTPRFTDDFREEIVRLMGDKRMQGHGAAHVVTMPGLGGVAVRAFLSTVFLLGRSSSPNKVFSDPATAAAWLVPALSEGRERWTPATLLEAYEEVAQAPAAKAASDARPSL